MDVEHLRELLLYNHITGKLYWKFRPDSPVYWNKRYAGKEAGGPSSDGYIKVKVLGKWFKGHRLAYALYHGVWPKGVVDHDNGNRLDNSIGNLIDRSIAKNNRNHKTRSDNVSGYPGIRQTPSGRWEATIKFECKRRYLGVFEEYDLAVDARKVAEREFGFNLNHGRA